MARLALTTSAVLVAFASNSLLARFGLRDAALDPLTFTVLRLVSGAVVLGVVLRLRALRQPATGGGAAERPTGRWVAAAGLVGYALPFSLAYVTLPTGTGALILFGSVQLTMLGAAVVRGDRLSLRGWAGLVVSLVGLVLLVLPGVRAPEPRGAVLMALAGLSWGFYTLAGRASTAPVQATASNFTGASLLVVPLLLLRGNLPSLDVLRSPGAIAALVSGGIASAGAYALWYSVLPQLRRPVAAAVQLLVPVVAALMGVVALAEPVTMRLVVSSVLVLGGVAVTILFGKPRAAT